MTQYQELDPETRKLMDSVVDAIVEGLQEQAALMESGDIPMRPGPDALREFGAVINLVHLVEMDKVQPGG